VQAAQQSGMLPGQGVLKPTLTLSLPAPRNLCPIRQSLFSSPNPTGSVGQTQWHRPGAPAAAAAAPPPWQQDRGSGTAAAAAAAPAGDEALYLPAMQVRYCPVPLPLPSCPAFLMVFLLQAGCSSRSAAISPSCVLYASACCLTVHSTIYR
jgi:hypothetical protein